ncbi:tetratricopeptide repeat protein [bacterium]|jgi:parvulin-like peptidyl-prolyl isomerase|nr:tetratricopeptide repeat protein [bacterium]MBT3581759.1 tetratricopeptide repeat protein [bacterium]MBT4552659.1 tetratricopeptide repeat protein [bacterium]MBT5988121.1 tetratricopeptide repeat protein [bacterium]MBT7087404.1 tetratricopeptide repeat protein [bacterium]
MLNFFRKNAAKIGFILVVFFIGTMFSGVLFLRGTKGAEKAYKQRNLNSSEIAFIGNLPLNQGKYQSFLNMSLGMLANAKDIQRTYPEFMGILQYNAFNQALNYTVFLEYANEKNIKVSSKELKTALEDVYTKYKLKNKKELKDLLKKNNYSYKQFLRDFKDDLKVQKYINGLTLSIMVSDKDVEDKYTSVKIAHILLKTNEENDEAKDQDVLKGAQSIVEKINNGLSFSQAAKQYTDDPGTKEKNGVLGWINIGDTVEEFEYEAFNLQPGEMSKPVKTLYGYHIIKVLDKKVKKKPADFDLEKEKQALLSMKRARALQNSIQAYLLSHKLEISDEMIRAYDATQKGDFQTAINAYQALSSKQPNSPAPTYLLAQIYLLLGNTQEAKKVLQKAELLGDINKSISIPMVNVELGKIYLKEKDFKNKNKQFEKATILAGSNITLLKQLKVIFESLKEKRRVKVLNKKIEALEKKETAKTVKKTGKN